MAMRMVARFSEAPKSRMPRKVARMAKSEGIIASIRAVALRKTKRKTTKMSAAVMAKLCARVGTRLAPTFASRSDSPTTRIRAPASGPAPTSSQARAILRASVA